ncbi:uncharacterized protein GIIIspla2 isoform X3 [Hetaerina americana]|uniref:uncharacterized protein GIIIspla2 isoform X3 n=1 Tax=Hetaerina americana TaxID=62018 RepID=UPI003A7F304D
MVLGSLTLSAVVVLIASCLCCVTVRSARVRAALGEVGAGTLGKGVRDFVVTDVLPDGEVEKRVHYRGVAAKETSARSPSSEGGKRTGPVFRQVTDGAHFIQLIYAGDGKTLADCEYVRKRNMANKFLDTFRREVEEAIAASVHESTWHSSTTTTEVPFEGFDAFDDGALLPGEREKTYYNVTVVDLSGGRAREDKADNHVKRDPRLPHDLAWLDFPALRRQCRNSHRKMKAALHKKRSVMSDLERERVERELFRFRTCLKMAGTGTANLVGRLFFNVVQTKCFVLKPEKTCVRRSWWGKCTKKVIRKQAHLRDNLPY